MSKSFVHFSFINCKLGSVLGVFLIISLLMLSLSGCDLLSKLRGGDANSGFAMRSAEGSGIMNCDGEWVLEPVEKEKGLVTGSMVDGLAPFINVKENYHNFINVKGELLNDEKYDMVMPFSEGLAAVRVDDQWGYINLKGEFEIPPQFPGNWIGYFSEGMANVGNETDNFGNPRSWIFINRKGEQVLGPYDFAGPFSDGYARVTQISEDHVFRSGFIDTSGKFVLEFSEKDDFRSTGDYSEGLFPVVDVYAQLSEGLCSRGYMDNDANWVIPPQFCVTGVFRNGLAQVTQSTENPLMWGFINTKGEMVIPDEYVMVDNFSDGCARVFWDNYNAMGLIDSEGKFIYQFIR